MLSETIRLTPPVRDAYCTVNGGSAMVKAPHISEWTMVGTLLVHRDSVAGTSTIVHAVYEPSAVIWKHSSITHTDEHGWLGQLGSRPPPPGHDPPPPRGNGTWDQTRVHTID